MGAVRQASRNAYPKLILFGESSLRRALVEFQAHYHAERNHQGTGNVLLPSKRRAEDTVRIDASMPATPWRTPELLLPRRMNILTIRGSIVVELFPCFPTADVLQSVSTRLSNATMTPQLELCFTSIS